MKRAAIYYRVSGKDQAEHENIEVQKMDIRPWVEERGWSFEEFQDDGICGEAIKSRPGFASLLE